jgi:predicted nucleotidyltransferase
MEGIIRWSSELCHRIKKARRDRLRCAFWFSNAGIIISAMKTISPVIRKEVIRRLVDEFQPETIYLFGSYAWGKPDEDSDVDLLVIVPKSRENPIQRAVRAQRSLRGVKAAVDVIVKTQKEFQRYTSVKASLEAQIAKDGKLLYGRKTLVGA